jgi:hypothetical protein
MTSATPRATLRCAAERRYLFWREPGVALQQRDEPDEHQAHHNREDTADALQQKLIGDQRGRHPEHGHGAEQEHGGEASDEKQRSAGDPQPCGADGHAARLFFYPNHRRQVGQIARHQGHHAR